MDDQTGYRFSAAGESSSGGANEGGQLGGGARPGLGGGAGVGGAHVDPPAHGGGAALGTGGHGGGSVTPADGGRVGAVPDAASGASAAGAGAGGEGAVDNGTGGRKVAPAGGSPGSGGTLAQGGSEGGGAGAAGEMNLQLAACANSLLTSPFTATGHTTAADGKLQLSCGTGLSDDVTYEWVAPETAYYTISTAGSAFDTVLGLLSENCKEIACNDDASMATSSEIVRKFTAGDRVVIAVDGKSGDNGDYALSVQKVSCPTLDLTEQPLPTTLSTQDGPNEHDGPCGGTGRREKSIRWTAPSSGLFRFSVKSSDFSPALYVERGAVCGGELLGCNVGKSGYTPAEVVRQLDAGEVVTIVVDSTDSLGDFTLDIEALRSASCPEPGNVLAIDGYGFMGVPIDATTPSVLTASCEPSIISMNPSGTYALGEHTYAFHVPAGFSCYVDVDASAPVALYALRGTRCEGPEIACVEATGSNGAYSAEIKMGALNAQSDEDYVVVVELSSPIDSPMDDPATYDLYTFCAVI